jgi:hypothetical protein
MGEISHTKKAHKVQDKVVVVDFFLLSFFMQERIKVLFSSLLFFILRPLVYSHQMHLYYSADLNGCHH